MKITPVKITRFLATVVATLLILHLSTLFAKYVMGFLYLHGMLEMFSLDEERNIPTLFSVLLILSCSITTWVISNQPSEHANRLKRYWKLLAVCVFFLAMDEAFSIHELANKKQIANMLPSGDGFFYYSWVVPYFFLVLTVGILFLNFMRKLPAETMKGFMVAGLMYVCGALGMELLGGKYRFENGDDAYYYMITALEEVLEMSAMITFLHTLLTYFIRTRNSEMIALRLELSNHENEDRGEKHEKKASTATIKQERNRLPASVNLN